MSVNIETRRFVRVAKTTEISEGTMKEYKVGDQEIFIARVKDKFYAANNICPHMGGKLGQGTLVGTIVTCPRHASKFDLIDGSVVRWTDWTGIKASVSKLFRAPRPITTYRINVEGDDISVELER
jgi:3-phenylpropionate/trans-cinnamate dioxygenase ferredoxin component